DSVKKVESGSALVNQSGQTLDEIVASVKRVTDLVGDMASAAREQSTGIDQINRAVAQMDQVTQGNAAQTEEMSATAQGLTDQAEQLRALVARFRLSTESSRAAPDRPRATSASARRAVARRPAKVVRRALPAATFGHEGDGHDGNGRDRNGYHGNAHSRRAGTAVESLTSELGGEDTFNEA
ncbi:MAG TPA: methyl-accepting chemotaxis protein, partial [Candidatus Acidoferrum sp.]|nr:methyl-accepting chemotaxis protein [Candidatus Acidoferrum sp.]